jgi:hypothetical protein
VWWKHTATGTFKLAGTHAAITLRGLIVNPNPTLHPRTVFDAAELETIKARVNSSTQPQRNAWTQRVLPDANDGLNFTADPEASYSFDTGAGSGQGTVPYSRAAFWRNSTPAYACALAYLQTGDTRYANKAVQILNAWATKAPNMLPEGRSHPGLHIASFLVQFLYADDLLRGASYQPWLNARSRFETWWRNKPMTNIRAVISEKMPGNTPAQWRQGDGTNWLDAAINAMLAAGIAFEDNSLRDEMIERMENYFVGTWRIKKEPYGPGGAQVATLVRDAARNKDGVLLGVSYTGYAMSSMVQALEMARYCGTNLWNAKTPEGVGYQEVIEQWFRWNYLGEEFRGQTGNTVEKEPRMHSNVLEAANRNLDMSQKFKNYVANNRPIPGCPRDDYPTFTRG